MSMNQLERLQRTFQGYVLVPEDSVSTAWVSANGRAAPETQVSVYAHAYRARLKEVLANDFPAVLMAIGEDDFDQFADEYLKVHPSHYFSLRDFGRCVPEFLFQLVQQQERQNTYWENRQWLHELALFEWTLGQAFDAADVPLFTEEDMLAVPPEVWPELEFVLHPSVKRLDLEWNIPEMWRILTGDTPAQVSASRDVASPWLVWREQLVTRFRSVRTDEQLALDALCEGKNFNAVCEVLATLMSEDDVPLHAAGLLKGWIAQGLISGIRSP